MSEDAPKGKAEANEELSKTKQKMNKNSPTRVTHHKSCSSVKHEHFASLSHLLRPFPSQIWRPGLLTQGPSRLNPSKSRSLGLKLEPGQRKEPKHMSPSCAGCRQPLTQVTAHPHSDLTP